MTRIFVAVFFVFRSWKVENVRIPALFYLEGWLVKKRSVLGGVLIDKQQSQILLFYYYFVCGDYVVVHSVASSELH